MNLVNAIRSLFSTLFFFFHFFHSGATWFLVAWQA